MLKVSFSAARSSHGELKAINGLIPGWILNLMVLLGAGGKEVGGGALLKEAGAWESGLEKCTLSLTLSFSLAASWLP